VSDTQQQDTPFFILGSGRSGSTLLRMILACHSRIVIPPETWFLLDWTQRFDPVAPLAKAQVEEAVNLAVNHYRWPDFNIDAGDFRERALALRQPKLRALADIIFDEFRRREGRARWGDKTPPYCRIIPELRKIYPGALFIHLIRDGRDVTKSFHDRQWRGRLLHENTAEWLEATADIQRHRGQLTDEEFLEVRYEDLVLDTEATIGRICDFLGEETEPGMFSWEGAVAEKIPSRELHIHKKLLRKPQPTDVDRWKRELTPFQVACLEAYIGDRLSDFAYERSASLGAVSAAALRAYCATAVRGADFAGRAVGSLRRRLLGAPAQA